MIKQQQRDIKLLRFMLCELREKQSNISLNAKHKQTCMAGIIALENAIEAIQTQVYA